MSKYITLDNLTTYHNKVRNAINNASSAANPMENITYSALLSKVNSSTLTPGKKYRITDYCTTTNLDSAIGGSYKSAGHPFDLIVTATTNNSLNPIASAVQHGGDTYFTNSDLSKWIVWYSVISTSDFYQWRGSKGVIYRMIDEKNNDLPYDFKNIQFKRVLITAIADAPTNIGATWVGQYGLKVNNKVDIDSNDYKYYYTFTIEDHAGNIKDASLTSTVSSNFIEARVAKNPNYAETSNIVIQSLNNIVFATSDSYERLRCKNNIFQGIAYDLHFITDNDSNNGVYCNSFMMNTYNSLFYGETSLNNIKGYFQNSITCHGFNNNEVLFFNNNLIGERFLANTVYSLNNSIIEDDWGYNTIENNVQIVNSVGSDHSLSYCKFESNGSYNLDDEFWNLSPIQNDHLHFAKGNTNYEYATTTMSASSNALTGQVYERTSTTPSTWAIKNISIPLT